MGVSPALQNLFCEVCINTKFSLFYGVIMKKIYDSNSLKVYANKNKKPLIVSKKETNPAMKIALEQAMDKAIYSLIAKECANG
jgi:hypothetical protein